MPSPVEEYEFSRTVLYVEFGFHIPVYILEQEYFRLDGSWWPCLSHRQHRSDKDHCRNSKLFQSTIFMLQVILNKRRASSKSVGHENRRLKQFGITAMILIAAVLAMGQARPPRTIEAEVFLLKDVDGNVKAGGGTVPTKLIFLDRAGRERVGTHVRRRLRSTRNEGQKRTIGSHSGGGGIPRWNVVPTIAAGAPLMGPVGRTTCRDGSVGG